MSFSAWVLNSVDKSSYHFLCSRKKLFFSFSFNLSSTLLESPIPAFFVSELTWDEVPLISVLFYLFLWCVILCLKLFGAYQFLVLLSELTVLIVIGITGGFSVHFTSFRYFSTFPCVISVGLPFTRVGILHGSVYISLLFFFFFVMTVHHFKYHRFTPSMD